MRNPIYEALPISVAKPYVDAWKKAGMDKNLEEWFRGKNRLYYPLYGMDNKEINDIYQVVNDAGFIIVSFDEGIARKKGDDRNVKIGKVLARAGRQDLLDQYSRFAESIKEKKQKNMSATSEDLYVVISRHAYDIAGMTEGRDWPSCMGLESTNSSYILSDVKNGTIVSYLIKGSDRNINNPLSRILIKPFVNKDDPDDILMYPEKIYGLKVEEFRLFINDWLDKRQSNKSGLFNLLSCLYPDSKTQIDKRDILDRFEWEDRGDHIYSPGSVDLSGLDIKSLMDIQFPE